MDKAKVEEAMNWLFIELSRVESGLRVRLAEASGVKTAAVQEWNYAINKVPLESIGKKEVELAKEELGSFHRRIAAEGKEDALVSMIYAANFIRRKFCALQNKEQLMQILLLLKELISWLNDYREKTPLLQEQIETIKGWESLLREQAMFN